MPDRIKNIITNTLDVKWSNLLKPDTMFGDGSANHNITVVYTPELETVLMGIAKENGAKKINGLYEKDGVKTIKFKSKTHIDKGAFPCQDSTGQYTDVVPFGGDTVRLKLAPALMFVIISCCTASRYTTIVSRYLTTSSALRIFTCSSVCSFI